MKKESMPESESFPETLIFNGIDGASGSYLLPQMTPAQVSALAQGQSIEPDLLEDLEIRADLVKNKHAGVEADPRDLAQTGWGVIFAQDADPALIDALDPLIKLRKEQAGDRFKIYSGENGLLTDESKSGFLERLGMGPGPANPEKVPYYLLIVGDPSTISYRFQYQLDVQYAVGRLAFDTIEEYARYAQSAVQAEKGLRLPPRAAFFGVGNADDRATAMSADNLVQPLAEKLLTLQDSWSKEALKAGKQLPQWTIDTMLKEQATKANLGAVLGGAQAPALLFSASHGISFPNGDRRQLPHQGALICQDWPGPEIWREAIPQDFYFAGEDLSSDVNLLGTIAFFFACYGAGTPREDEFAHQIWSDQPERKVIAPYDFVAALPRRMMSLPKGGALAVVGHVERAWGVSFFWGKAGPQLQVFQDTFQRLMKGNNPIGYAVEEFNNRYAEISSELTTQLEDIRYRLKKPKDMELARTWTANNDARNYILLGDPAVRLAVDDGSADTQERPSIPEIASPPVTTSATVTTVTVITPSSEAAAGTPVVGAAGVDYGLMDSFKQAQANLSGTLGNFVSRLSDFLSKALDEATSLEVSTYVSEDMSQVKYQAGQFTGARLRALTRIEIDGDTLICVPESEGEVDTTLWKIHMDMVQQAQVSRTELLKTVVSAATGLVDLIKP